MVTGRGAGAGGLSVAQVHAMLARPICAHAQLLLKPPDELACPPVHLGAVRRWSGRLDFFQSLARPPMGDGQSRRAGTGVPKTGAA